MANVNSTAEFAKTIEEVENYLIANGYSMNNGAFIPDTKYFFRGEQGVVIYKEIADFIMYGPDATGKQSYKRTMLVTDIQKLKIFDWMLLFHLAGIVPLRQFISNVRKEIQLDASDLLTPIMEHFRVLDNHESVPLNY